MSISIPSLPDSSSRTHRLETITAFLDQQGATTQVAETDHDVLECHTLDSLFLIATDPNDPEYIQVKLPNTGRTAPDHIDRAETCAAVVSGRVKFVKVSIQDGSVHMHVETFCHSTDELLVFLDRAFHTCLFGRRVFWDLLLSTDT